jgi:hypothetical protein
VGQAIPPGSYAFRFDTSETIVADVVEAGMQTTVVPVTFRLGGDGGAVSTEGTAFALAGFANGEAVYATAAHVVACLESADDIEPFISVPRTDNLGGPRALHGVRIKQISIADTYCDVALFVVNVNDEPPTAGLVVKPLPVSLSEPVVGERCMALGYPQEVGRHRYDLTASRGIVEEVHPSRRDSVGIPYPSFRTNGNYLPSMSGGPIIDTKGHVLGVISRGMDIADDAHPTSYGAVVASIIEHKVDLHTDQGDLHEFSVPDLVARGAVRASDDRVTLTRNDDGVALKWE